MEYVNAVGGLFQKGGLVMYPLTVCSVIVAAIAVERYLYYRQADGKIDLLIDLLLPAILKKDWTEANNICLRNGGAVAQILRIGVEALRLKNCNLESVLEGASSIQAAYLRKRLDYLDTIVTLAPLLGLLGTVMGMINTFSVLNIRAGQTQAITGGVGEALIATAFGLCVAILALAVYSYFRHWLDGIVTDIEKACNFLVGKVAQDETA